MNDNILYASSFVVPDPLACKGRADIRAHEVSASAEHWLEELDEVASDQDIQLDNAIEWHEPDAVYMHLPKHLIVYFLRSMNEYGRIAPEVGKLICNSRKEIILVVTLQGLPPETTHMLTPTTHSGYDKRRHSLLFESMIFADRRKKLRLLRHIVEIS
ncbi:MAG TPA: hypothetical protein VJB60_01660 [Candidatus Peribacterales bacterium]|nr:hypothetical protein [Candidatus Peribacterales bacterium]